MPLSFDLIKGCYNEHVCVYFGFFICCCSVIIREGNVFSCWCNIEEFSVELVRKSDLFIQCEP